MIKDPFKYFRVEARELLQGLVQGVLELERGSVGEDRISGLLRLAHTLKGASAVVQHPGITGLAHSIETVLAPHRNSDEPVPKPRVAELLRLTDQIGTKLADLETASAPKVSARARASSEEPLETVRVQVDEVDAVLGSLSEASVRLTAIRQQTAAIGRARQLAHLLVEQVHSRPTGPAAASCLKVEELAGELSSCLERLDRGLTAHIEQADRELSHARERADHLRLLSAGTMFPSLTRAVRDAAQALGKRVQFDTAGGDIRVDAPVVMIVRDALLHLVRNAVAHGIESEGARTAAGKPGAGRVEVQIERRGSSVVFTCRDDGSGIDVKAIRRLASLQGAPSAARSESEEVHEAIELILQGGISTTGTVTELSGRGIGMNIVREAAARLKGNVAIETAPGRGTTVEVRVPASLTSVAAVKVEATGVVAFLPLASVRQTLLVPDEAVVYSGSQKSIAYDSRMIPFLPLPDGLGLQKTVMARGQRWSTLLVNSGSDLVAIGVDRVLSVETVLVREVPAVAAADPVVAGASVDAEGKPRLVLDPAGLVAAANRAQAPARTAGPVMRRPILVIDDSLTTRMLEQSILESAGHLVDVASSAEEALEKAKAVRYSLFLVDVEMPGIDGFEFVAKVRADPVLQDTPAVMVTSRNSDEDRRRGEAAGASAYMVKSEFDQRYLLQIIRKLLGEP